MYAERQGQSVVEILGGHLDLLTHRHLRRDQIHRLRHLSWEHQRGHELFVAAFGEGELVVEQSRTCWVLGLAAFLIWVFVQL